MLLAPIMAGHNATDDDGGAAGAVRVPASNEEKDELKRRRSIVVDFVSVLYLYGRVCSERAARGLICAYR